MEKKGGALPTSSGSQQLRETEEEAKEEQEQEDTYEAMEEVAAQEVAEVEEETDEEVAETEKKEESAEEYPLHMEREDRGREQLREAVVGAEKEEVA